MKVRVFAPAKVNLTLKVGMPRADGLHPLQSVVAFGQLDEWVEAAPAKVLSLTIVGPMAQGLAADETNLVLRAARALAAAAKIADPGTALTLHKDMPVASGIGGGSSDAAATLKALNVLWGLGLSEAKLIKVARTLGADVPVCVAGRSAFMIGAGERFVDLDVPELHAVLVNPMAPLPTPSVYRRFDEMGLGAELGDEPPPAWATPDEAIAGAMALGNDLAKPARALLPEIADIESRLHGDPRVRHAALSGSGATVFGLVGNRNEAEFLAHSLQSERPHWWVRAVVLAARA